MHRSVIALILSALIFPGIGQMYKGDIKKGVFLILTASLLLAVLVLSILVAYSYAYADLVAQATSPEAIEPAQLQALLGQVLSRPFILFTFGLLLATWVYGICDAVRRPG